MVRNNILTGNPKNKDNFPKVYFLFYFDLLKHLTVIDKSGFCIVFCGGRGGTDVWKTNQPL